MARPATETGHVRGVSETGTGTSARPAKPRVRRLLDRIDGGRVLHIGAVGHDDYRDPDSDWTHGYLARVADELVGVDVDRQGVRDLRAEGWDVRVDDATRLSTVEEPVDWVVAPEVVEHLDSPGALFAAAREVLTEDGRLLLTTPNPWALCYIRRVVAGEDPVGNDEHTCWIDATTLRELASRHGFDGETEHLPPVAGGLTSAAYRLGRPRLGGTRLFGEFEASADAE